MNIAQIICYFVYIVFLSRMSSGFYGILNSKKSTNHVRKKYKIAKITNYLDNIHC